MIPARNYRHAREGGHPKLAPGLNRGWAGTAFTALGPRFCGATGKEELGTICLVHTTSALMHYSCTWTRAEARPAVQVSGASVSLYVIAICTRPRRENSMKIKEHIRARPDRGDGCRNEEKCASN